MIEIFIITISYICFSTCIIKTGEQLLNKKNKIKEDEIELLSDYEKLHPKV